MKKLLFMLMGVAATINAMAVTYTAKANILLEATSGESCELYLRQSDSYGALDGYDMFMTGRLVALYAIKGEQKLEMAKAADLTNLQLGLLTDASTSYTLTVSGVEGTPLVLWDLVNNDQITLANGVYNIDAAANSTIENRFVINYEAAPVPVYDAEATTNEFGLATFSFGSDLQKVEDDLKIYKGAINGDNLDLTLVADVKANEGVLLYGEPNTTYHFTAGAAAANFDDNGLKAASTWASRDINHAFYVLSGDALYKYEGSTFPGDKAYLELDSPHSAPHRIALRFNQPTDIENVVEAAKAEKFVENGQIFIRRGNEVFNLQGQIVK